MAKEKPADETKATETKVSEDTSKPNDLLEAKPRDRSNDSRFKRFWHAYTSKKKFSIPATVVVALAIVLAVPMTRYQALGLFIQKNFSVRVLDAESGKPVSEAEVALAGRTAQTDADGKATIQKVKPGNAELRVTKKYFKDFSQTTFISLTDGKNSKEVKLQATGRQVSVTVKNKINGKVLDGVTISALDTEAKTDDKGQATIVLPANQKTVKATLSLKGYNDFTGQLEIVEQSGKNEFSLTPSGKIYFLSKKSGRIDLVKTNLDGTDRKTVLAGTGREQDGDTVLLASRDWKYLALKSRREGELAKLYLIESSNDKVSTMDEGDANFGLVGWQGNYFIYTVNRNSVKLGDNKKESLKSFNAPTKQITILDDTAGETLTHEWTKVQRYQNLGWFALLDDRILYAKFWNHSYGEFVRSPVQGKQDFIMSIRADGQNKQTLEDFDAASSVYLNVVLYKPNEVYYSLNQLLGGYKDRTIYYEFEEGQLKPAQDLSEAMSKSYPTYLLSPSGKEVFWSEARDGKSTLFVGDNSADKEKEIAALSQFKQYGWYTDDLLLVSKDSSELHIMAKSKGAKPLKISDYHKPDYYFNGYGGGYGGL